LALGGFLLAELRASQIPELITFQALDSWLTGQRRMTGDFVHAYATAGGEHGQWREREFFQ